MWTRPRIAVKVAGRAGRRKEIEADRLDAGSDNSFCHRAVRTEQKEPSKRRNPLEPGQGRVVFDRPACSAASRGSTRSYSTRPRRAGSQIDGGRRETPFTRPCLKASADARPRHQELPQHVRDDCESATRTSSSRSLYGSLPGGSILRSSRRRRNGLTTSLAGQRRRVAPCENSQ